MSKEQKKVPAPLLLSAIICDTVILDALTRKPTIIGIFENISAPRYPARHPRLAFFCEFTNGHGKTKITVRLVDIQQEDKVLFEQAVEAEFSDVRQVVNLTFDIGGILFPHPGEYRIQVYAGTEFRGERRIICRQIELPSGGINNGSENG